MEVSGEPFIFDVSMPVVQLDNGLLNKGISSCTRPLCNLNTFGHLLHKQSRIGKRVYIPYTKPSFDSETENFKLIAQDNDINHRVSNLVLSYYPRTQGKFSYMAKTILNRFLSEDVRTDFMIAFSRAQRLYYALSRFARAVKFRLSSHRNSEDMFMNRIRPTDRNVISILQHGQLYLFTITDLKRIIDTALSNSPWFFNEPLPVKNPYNNIPFQKSDLYNIYFFMKSRIIHMSPLFHQYFMSNFNLGHFRDENPALIQSVYIHQYVKNMDADGAYDCIKKIFRSVNYGLMKIEIDDDFSKDRLLAIMRPYVLLYYLSTVSFDVIIKQTNVIRLKRAMIDFYRFNPLFGRRFITAGSGVVSFNDKHKRFRASTSMNSFATSHLDDSYGHDDGHDDDGDIDDGSDTDSESVVIAVNPRQPDYHMQVQIVGVEGGLSDEDDYEYEEENEEIYDP
jgi:hypothetical protein